MRGWGLCYPIGSKASAEHPEQSGIISRNDVSASGLTETDLKDNGAHDKLGEADPKEQVSPWMAGNRAISLVLRPPASTRGSLGITSRHCVSASWIMGTDLQHNGAHGKLMEADQKEQVAPWVAGNHSIGFKASSEYPRQPGNHTKAV